MSESEQQSPHRPLGIGLPALLAGGGLALALLWPEWRAGMAIAGGSALDRPYRPGDWIEFDPAIAAGGDGASRRIGQLRPSEIVASRAAERQAGIARLAVLPDLPVANRAQVLRRIRLFFDLRQQ